MCEAATKYGILVGVDGSVEAVAAIRWATREALLCGQPITLMHVVAPAPDWATPSRQAQLARAWEKNANDVIEQARQAVLAGAGGIRSSRATHRGGPFGCGAGTYRRVPAGRDDRHR